jgi:uncharacterized membrane protein YphA (DoxX/SURF4 family)
MPSVIVSYAVFAFPSFIGTLLLIFGLVKVTNIRQFIQTVAQYDLLPRLLVKPVSHLIAYLEVTLGALLLAGVVVPSACRVSSLLFACFAVAISVNLARGRTHISCGCFGSSSVPISWGLASRNLLFALAAFLTALFFSHSPELRVDRM